MSRTLKMIIRLIMEIFEISLLTLVILEYIFIKACVHACIWGNKSKEKFFEFEL